MVSPQKDLEELVERLRDRVVGALHVGRIRAGDRLPGVREVARETGANPRTVAKAYRELERQGLVEVRGRSGVYVARQDHWGGTLLAETGRWLGGILLEAWKRHIPVPDLPDIILRCTSRIRLRAACVDGIEDHRRALCAELAQAFGIACSPLRAEDLPEEHTATPAYPAILQQADMVVTTPFHAPAALRVAEVLEKPMVVITLHPDLVSAIEQHLEEGGLTVICVDPEFGEQVRTLYGGDSPDRIRIITADDERSLASLDPEGPVLLTRAARERLGEAVPTSIAPLAPFISPESARQIAELMIRLHLAAEHTSRGRISPAPS